MQQSKRWITAVIVLPFLYLLLVKGSVALLTILLSVVSILTLREYFKIVFPLKKDDTPLSLKFFSYLVAISLSGFAFSGSWNIILLILYLNIIIIALISLANFSRIDSIIDIVCQNASSSNCR